MLKVAAVLSASASVPFSVMVTAPPVAVAVAPPAPVNPLTSAIVGAAGMTNDDGNMTVIVWPVARAPVPLDVNPTVQVVPVAPAAWDEPAKVTAEVAVAADAGSTS